MSNDREKPQYIITVDGGVGSLGWAVTDMEYRLLKSRGKDLWGVYLFDEAETAAKRRGYRCTRRRYTRVHKRIKLLQSLFASELEKTQDPYFFLRLNNSQLIKEDKNVKVRSSYSLFNDPSFTDKDFFKRYPTIYHLRKALIKGEVDDVRLLYLGIHHILKNRGHFLLEGQEFRANDIGQIKLKFKAINEFLSDDFPKFDLDKVPEVLEVLLDNDKGKKLKLSECKTIFKIKNSKQLEAILKLIIGFKNIKVKTLFDLTDSESKIDFTTGVYENKISELEMEIGEDISLVDNAKAIYDWSVLNNILRGEKYLSFAKVETFNQHKTDLLELKSYVREIDKINPKSTEGKTLYDRIFHYDKKDKPSNYAAYVGKDLGEQFGHCTREQFLKYLGDILKENKCVEGSDRKAELDKKLAEILDKIDKDIYLPKLRSNINASIPMQVHKMELREILSKAEKKFEFLTEKDANGVTVSEKILILFDYRIPYYVGPLNAKSEHAWAVRVEGQEHTKITPWNFDEVIDRDASEEKFIRRMTSKCTYIFSEDVLPKFSLLYSEFAFLNELNNLRINNEKNDQAKKLILEYAQKSKTITKKKYVKLLMDEGIITVESQISGIDGDFKNTLRSHQDFEFLLKDDRVSREIVEDIILRITLTPDKNRLASYLDSVYGGEQGILTTDDIKRIKSFNYTKWGRLSKCLLEDIKSEIDGKDMSIIEAMRCKTENLQELLSNRYGFKDKINEKNEEDSIGESLEVTRKTISDLYCSPAVKRAVWKTVQLVQEIVKDRGYYPKKVFIEMARELNDNPQKGKRTKSRKMKLLAIFNGIKDKAKAKDATEQDKHLLENLNKYVDIDSWISKIKEVSDYDLKSNKTFFYYTQLGRDMYTGEKIKKSDIMNVELYDKDHIYPKSKIKDDSLDNLVLTKSTVNKDKDDIYPIDKNIRQSMSEFWGLLRDAGLISQSKYFRLTRDTALTADDFNDFIERQLTFTRQINIITCRMLEQLFKYRKDEQGNLVEIPKSERTKIVYAKAGNTADFKEKIGYIKIREMNDLHHAKDAYINAIVGNVYDTIFSRKNDTNQYQHINLAKLYEKDIPNAWKVNYLESIKNTVEKNTCRVVQMTNEKEGQLFDDTIYPAAKDLLPLKGDDNDDNPFNKTGVYGGYNKKRITYYMLVKSKDEHGNDTVSLEDYPLVNKLKTQHGVKGDSLEAKIKYLESIGLKEPKILLDKIKENTLLSLDGTYVYLTGKTGNSLYITNANQLTLEREMQKILKRAINHVKASKENGVNLLPNDKASKKDTAPKEDTPPKEDNVKKDDDKKEFKLKAWHTVDGKKQPMTPKELKADNIKLYNRFIEELKKDKYTLFKYVKHAELLEGEQEKFSNLTVEEQCFTLVEILRLLQPRSTTGSNLKLLGRKVNISRNTLYKRGFEKLSTKIIYQSPAGIYKKVLSF